MELSIRYKRNKKKAIDFRCNFIFITCYSGSRSPEKRGPSARTGKMSFPRNVSPLAQKIRYDIENLFLHQYVHHPVYFRETDFKPGSFIYNNKERADEMLYFVKESAKLLDNILLKWKAEVHFSLSSTLFRTEGAGQQAHCCTLCRGTT